MRILKVRNKSVVNAFDNVEFTFANVDNAKSLLASVHVSPKLVLERNEE
jgi:hypothetical protein